MTKKGKYVEVDTGVELFVQVIGEGEPVVFVPGWTFTSEVFYQQVEKFSKTNRVLVVDPRSHGRSTVTMHGNDYVTHGTDLKKVLETLDVKNPTLIGWSFGCLTLWEYGRQFGYENVNGMVFVDMPPKSLSIKEEDDWVEGKLDDLAAAYTAYLRNSQGQRDFVSSYASNVMVQRELTEEELNWIVEQSLHTPYYIAASLFASGLFSDYTEEAKNSSEQLPTLYIVAEHWGETAASYLKRVAPNSKVQVLGGHFMFWEHGDEFNRIVEGFLSEKG
ncbi:alpha/beta fold hydrolase [Bacillus coahuilensis]|uniref:alpha/beta fold hydrolase n=1 Tax=Bacillus coahuilensis TaxID=408580 RepID=UPI00018508F6|nr:alpha/beta hydrolase [Bacillus coahuilensis]